MKVFVAQTGPRAGNFRHNFDLIKKYYRLAEDNGADICLLPELSTTGYYCEDLFLKRSFIEELEAKIEELLPMVEETVLVLPTPISEGRKLRSGVIVIQQGKIIGRTYKKHLPNSGIFDEKRYFTEGMPRVIEMNGHTIGIPICEDIWHSDVSLELKNQGAEVLLVPNGSPYDIRKMDKRLALVKKRFAEVELPIIYCNQALGHDGIVFDGRSFAYDGALKLQMPIYLESHSLVTVENSVINCHPQFISGFRIKSGMTPTVILNSFQDPETSSGRLRRFGMTLYDEIYGAMVFGLREYLFKNGIASVVLGLSGGVDSALVAAIAADAIGAGRVKAVMMPSKFTSRESLEDAKQVAEMLGVSYEIKPIDSLVNLVENEVLMALQGTAAENLQSRLRGLILMAISNNEGSLVLTTGNKSEIATGYATLYGDMCGGFNPIKDLYKTQVFEIARFRNAHLPESIEVRSNICPVMPERVITKAPSAELRKNQQDSDSLPEYPILDRILELYIEEDLGQEEIVSKGFDAVTVAKVARLVQSAEFKRRQSAPGVKISTRNFEKDRRYPITR